MHRSGEDFGREEYGRVFISWNRERPELDPYARIRSKIKKKRHQTKSDAGIYGRIIFLESQWNLDLFDHNRLSQIVDHELDESRNTVAVFIAQRCASVHYRRWYKFFQSKIWRSYGRNASLIPFLYRVISYDRDFDVILNQRYSRTWEDAAQLAKQHEAEAAEQNRRREEDL